MLDTLRRTGLVALAFSATAGLFAIALAPAPALAAVAGAATAKPAGAVKRIPLAGFDLTLAHDLRLLDERITAAATSVCGGDAACQAGAKSRADAQVASLRKVAKQRDAAGFSGKLETVLLVSGR